MKKETKHKDRLGQYAKTALKVLGLTAGIVALALFPGLGIVVKEFTRTSRRTRYSAETMKRTMKRLEKRGLVCVVARGEELTLQLTKKGREALKDLELETLCIPKPSHWDGQWRCVAFDIPEKKHANRQIFRHWLKRLGFVSLQKSLLVYPYPCMQEVVFLARTFDVEPHVHLLTVSDINGVARLRKHFGL